MFRMVNCASTCANHTSGLVDQKRKFHAHSGKSCSSSSGESSCSCVGHVSRQVHQMSCAYIVSRREDDEQAAERDVVIDRTT